MSGRRALILVYGALIAVAASWALPRLSAEDGRFEVAMRLIADGRGAEAAHLLDDQIWRGVAEYRAGRYRRAVVEFTQSREVTGLYNLGTSYARLGEWTGARVVYELVLSLDPAHEDAAHNLALVRAAEARQEEEVEAQQDIRTVGVEKGEKGAGTDDETDGETTEEDAAPSADAAATERTADQAGQVPSPGRTGGAAQTEDAAAGRGLSAEGAADRESGGRAGAGAVRILDASAQDAEILLRAIEDDPAKVLRARLWSIDRKRREAAR